MLYCACKFEKDVGETEPETVPETIPEKHPRELFQDSGGIIMRKCLIVCCMLLTVLAVPAASGELGIKVGDIEALDGYKPFLLEVGAKYTGVSFIPGYETSLELMTGGGYMNRKVWRDAAGKPLSGVDLSNESQLDAVSFDIWSARWDLLVKQGFGWFELEARNPVFLYAGIGGRWEQWVEDGSSSTFIDDDGTVFPDSADDMLIANSVRAGVIADYIAENGPVPKGIKAEASFAYAPPFLFNTAAGSSDYALFTGEVKAAVPLYMSYQKNGTNLFSIYLADRIRADRFFGSEIPVFAQDKASLGSKMRGLERLSYATEFSAVNNFDVRFIGPEFAARDIYPRLHLFFDAGYFSGSYSGDVSAAGVHDENGWLLSAGFTAALSIFDFANVGYRGSYMLQGKNVRDKDFVSDIILMLKFNL